MRTPKFDEIPVGDELWLRGKMLGLVGIHWLGHTQRLGKLSVLLWGSQVELLSCKSEASNTLAYVFNMSYSDYGHMV